MLVAVAAAIGNLLQGWDNATIAGNLFLSIYIGTDYINDVVETRKMYSLSFQFYRMSPKGRKI